MCLFPVFDCINVTRLSTRRMLLGPVFIDQIFFNNLKNNLNQENVFYLCFQFLISLSTHGHRYDQIWIVKSVTPHEDSLRSILGISRLCLESNTSSQTLIRSIIITEDSFFQILICTCRLCTVHQLSFCCFELHWSCLLSCFICVSEETCKMVLICPEKDRI